jgi:hypothetical protein
VPAISFDSPLSLRITIGSRLGEGGNKSKEISPNFRNTPQSMS